MTDDLVNITDDISKWDITGLNDSPNMLGKYNISKMLNNQSAIMKRMISSKWCHASSPIIQCMLSVTSEAGKRILNSPKVVVLTPDAKQPHDATYPFLGNVDIRIHLTQYVLETPLPDPNAQVYSMEFEDDHMVALTDELSTFYKDILSDDRLEYLFVHSLIDATDGVYYTSYATFYEYH